MYLRGEFWPWFVINVFSGDELRSVFLYNTSGEVIEDKQNLGGNEEFRMKYEKVNTPASLYY